MLGEISIAVPPGPKGRESIDITYTYDMNSLLEVDVLVRSTGKRRKLLIQSGVNKLSDEEATARMEQLQYLKQNPREEEANRLILLRGERLYEEATSDQRIAIDRAMMDFERALKKQDRIEIEKARKRLSEVLSEAVRNLGMLE